MSRALISIPGAASAGNRELKNVFGAQGGGNPFSSLTLDWCPRCGETETDTHASHRGTTYVYKRWCQRCGRVLKWGVYHNVPLMHAPTDDRSLLATQLRAVEFVTTAEQDRR